MTIQHIGDGAVALYINKSELQAFDLTPEKIGLAEAKLLLARALTGTRLTGWETAELTVFPGIDSVLLFARKEGSSPRHFFFSDFEALVTAAHFCPESLPSGLSRIPGGYVLTVYPFVGETPPAVLYEFSEELGNVPYLLPHLGEQGAALLPISALSYLRTHFPRMESL